MDRRAAPILVLIAALVAPAAAVADESPKQDDWFVETFLSGLGGIVHRDATGGFDAMLAFGKGSFRTALAAPMRFGRGGLRRADWDEVNDYGRIVADVGWGRPDDLFSFRAGSLADVTLGVGNLVSRYSSTLDPDHWRSGVQAAIHADVAGADLFVDSFLGPSVTAGRVYVRPFWPLNPGGIAGRIELGASAAFDFQAPEDLVFAADHGIALASANLPDATHRVVTGLGLDLRWPVVKFPQVEVTPYTAFGWVAQAWGVHAGIDLAFEPAKGWRFGLTGEFRRLWDGYVASWFDTTYMADRIELAGLTKLRGVEQFTDTRLGMMVGAWLKWKRAVSFWTVLDLDQDGRWSALRAGFALEYGRFRAGLLFAEKGLPQARSLVSPDRLFFAASLDVELAPVIAVFASYARDVAVRTDGPDRGRYLPSDTAMGGFRLQFKAL